MAMILIDGEWEQIYDMEDAITIVRDKYNYDLGRELKGFFDVMVVDYNDLERDLESAQAIIDELEIDIDVYKDEIHRLNDRIEELLRELEKKMEFDPEGKYDWLFR